MFSPEEFLLEQAALHIFPVDGVVLVGILFPRWTRPFAHGDKAGGDGE